MAVKSWNPNLSLCLADLELLLSANATASLLSLHVIVVMNKVAFTKFVLMYNKVVSNIH